MNKNEAQKCYEEAVVQLNNYCDNNTRLGAAILDGEYPFRVQFVPEYQPSMFDIDDIDPETGEVKLKDEGELIITVGLTTSVKCTLKFKMDSKQLKKLIKLAETVGNLYYQAFREGAADPLPADDFTARMRQALEKAAPDLKGEEVEA